jgi:hypothetical protein
MDLEAEKQWPGGNQNKATFPVISSPHDAAVFLSQIRCYNCGGPHYLQDCTAPKDQGRIVANRKQLNKIRKVAKKEGKDNNTTTLTSKWPPTPGRGENNYRTIDGKEYFYHFKKGKWLLADPNHRNSRLNRQANVVEGIHTTRSTQSIAGDDWSTRSTQSRRVQIAVTKLSQQLNEILSQFMESLE